MLYNLCFKIESLCKRYRNYYNEKNREKCVKCGSNIDAIGHGIRGCVKCGEVTEIWVKGSYVKTHVPTEIEE